MVAIWSSSDNSRSESEDEEIANVCFMAKESLRENDESKEITLKYVLTLAKKYFAQGLLNVLNLKKIIFPKSKLLEMKTKFEKRNMKPCKNCMKILHRKINDLENEKLFYKTKVMILTNLSQNLLKAKRI